jgi:hypothetical protein
MAVRIAPLHTAASTRLPLTRRIRFPRRSCYVRRPARALVVGELDAVPEAAGGRALRIRCATPSVGEGGGAVQAPQLGDADRGLAVASEGVAQTEDDG